MSNKVIDIIKLLSAEQIEAANSGHPGLPLGAAPIGYTLYAKAMKYSPNNPKWVNRDRFVLSAGHGSALLYSLLHLFSTGVSIDDLKRFRQLGSKTPGHPESDLTPGVDMSTGPLGQGIANAVGLAIAEKKLAQKFNRDGYDVFDHYTYVLHGDGCLMEGISYEACSLAGHLKLGKLIMLYDSNKITIEGSTDLAFTENIEMRFKAMGWEYILVEDGEDVSKIYEAIEQAKKSDIPSLIEIKTVIGRGAKSVEGKSKAHGSPLGAQGIMELYEHLGVSDRTAFEVPEDVIDELKPLKADLNAVEARWHEMVKQYKEKYPGLGSELEAWLAGPGDDLKIQIEEKPGATRSLGQDALVALYKEMPSLLGGSADLGPSNKTEVKGAGYIDANDFSGANIHYGIREHAMGAIAVGIQSHGGLRTFTSTFLTFSNYMLPPIRMAAMMHMPVVFIFTHDSIGVGEDGPTHQPIDQLAALRAIPRLNVFRPADAREVMAAYEQAFTSKDRPSVIALSRQNLSLLDASSIDDAKMGAYIIRDAERPNVNIVATGSEVEIALKAADILEEKGKSARVVSMPSTTVFETAPDEYKNKMLSKSLTCVSIEAAATLGWNRYADYCIGIDDFGLSGPGDQVYMHFGLTPEKIAERILEHIE